MGRRDFRLNSIPFAKIPKSGGDLQIIFAQELITGALGDMRTIKLKKSSIFISSLFLLVLSIRVYATPPNIVDFDSTVSELNEITLFWHVSGSSLWSTFYIFENGAPDIGFTDADCDPGADHICSVTIRVERGGVHRFTLQAFSGWIESTSVEIDVEVASLAPPTFSSYTTDVDFFDIQNQTLDWVDYPGNTSTGFIQVSAPGGLGFPKGTSSTGRYALDGTYSVSASKLDAGRNVYNVRYCEEYQSGDAPLCSEGTSHSFLVQPSRLNAQGREFYSTNDTVSLNWGNTSLANFWHWELFRTPRKLFDAAIKGNITGVGDQSLQFSTVGLAEGVYQLELNTCYVLSGLLVGCVHQADQYAPKTGTINLSVAEGIEVTTGDEIARILPAAGGPVEIVKSKSRGKLTEFTVSQGSTVTNGDVVAVVEDKSRTRSDIIEIVIDDSIPTATSKDWDVDFDEQTLEAIENWQLPWVGHALDVVLDSNNDIWQVGEFSTNVTHISNSQVNFHRTPLGRVASGASPKTSSKPYKIAIFGGIFPTTVSVAGERIIDSGDAIWYTQGGGLLVGDVDNHSRVVRFDKNGTDLSVTPDDDRLCSIHMPGGGNQIVGIAHDGNRVWVVESRPSANGGPRQSAISWFVDDIVALGCDNNLNYDDPVAVQQASDDNACADDYDTDCIHSILIPSSLLGVDVGLASHIIIDPPSYAWFAVSQPGALGRVSLTATIDPVVELFPLPKSIAASFVGGYAWQVRSDSEAVYIGEYSDRQLLRFDKAQAAQDDCTILQADGSNLCVDQITLPLSQYNLSLHSIDLEDGKLWFTLANEDLAPGGIDATTFGYVDTVDWALGAPAITMYSGISNIGTGRPGDIHSFRGIDVSADGNVVVLADHGYSQVIRMTKPSPP